METNEASIRIGKRTFLTAVLILAALMVIVGILTWVIPAGSYERVTQDGRDVLVEGTFRLDETGGGYPLWRWLTAPVEVLAGPDGPTVIVIILFLLCIAGAVTLLERSAVLSSVLAAIVGRFIRSKYVLMAVIVFAFMAMGAVLGTFEENIALVPIVIALAYCLGWDSLTGLGMSLLASCFGFTAAITNPFSIAITQQIAQLPLYSASGFRVAVFLIYYGLLMAFLLRYARRIEKDPARSLVHGQDEALRRRYATVEGLAQALGGKTPEQLLRLRRAIVVFGASVVLLFAVVLAASFIPALSDLALPLIGLVFLLGAVAAALTAGLGGRNTAGALGKSCAAIAPGIVLILMAMSVKFIISQGGIMDTILHWAAVAISATSPYVAVLLIYLLILVLELFIGSSSAKAFLIMPLIAPLSDLVGITRQTSVLAFCFGDGFSNVLYPTNPVLLICLGLTVVAYPQWFRWTWKLQLAALAVACVILWVAVAIKLGPF